MSGATVLVTDARLGSAVSIIRSLGRRGYRVVAADSEPHAPGFYSRYVQERVRYPSPAEDPEAAVESIAAAVAKRAVDLVMPVTDEMILPLLAQRERIEQLTRLALPAEEAWLRTRDKESTLELARSLGVPAPRTAVVTTAAEAREHAAELGWPVVLKPQASRLVGDAGITALSVRYAGGFARLDEHMAVFEGRCPVLLQEYYRGEALGVELLLDRGRTVAAFQHRRLREVPITGGASSFREGVPLDETLLALSERMLGALDWTGLAMVEFKVGADGPRLMEINGRVWGSLPLAVKSGVDFPALAAELYLSGGSPDETAPRTSYEVGVRSRNVDLEVVWIASVLRGDRRYPFLVVPPRRRALVAAARLPLPADGFDIIARDDPGPGMVDVARIVAKLRRKLADAR